MRNKRLLGAVLVIGTLITTSVLVYGASQQITADLDSGITIKYNGNTQIMKDANGKTVYPIIYEGTTYVPIRAVSNMLGIDVKWVGSTRTVELGTATSLPRSLIDAGRPSGYWSSIISADNLPQRPGYSYEKALRSNKGESVKVGTFSLDDSYNSLSFTIYYETDIRQESTISFEIINRDTGVIVFSRDIKPGEFLEVKDVNINGIKTMELNTKHWMVYSYTLWLLNPAVE